MKYVIALLALALATASCLCHPDPSKYTVPAGYQRCNSDPECPSGYYCGFVGVDTYPVCRAK